MPQSYMEGKDSPEFAKLDEFTQGYIESMFWTSEAPGVTTEQWQATEDHNEGSIPGDVGFYDLAPDALQDILRDCKAFQDKAAVLLNEAYEDHGYSEDCAGHDFWLTRNHHGTGFWDREALEPGDLGKRLTKLAHEFGESDSYLGDDGKVYVT